MSHSIEPQVADHRAHCGGVLVMNHSEDDTTGVSSRDENELGLKIHEAFRHARNALQGGRITLELLRTTQSKSYRASAVHSLDSIWTHRNEIGSKVRSYAMLQAIEPNVHNIIDNAYTSGVFNIDRERTSSVLEASMWVGEWGAHLLEAVNELIYMQERFIDAWQVLKEFIPIGGLENLEQTIEQLQVSIDRAETVSLSTLREIAPAASVSSQQADDGDRDGVKTDGLYRADALFVWNGKHYEWLTETMMDVLELLYKCYPDAVKPSAIEYKIGVIPEDGFKKIFRVNRKTQRGKHDVVLIIGGRAPKGWYLIK